MTGYENCHLCPRACGIDRTRHRGLCGGGSLPRLARAALHFWEEPCISGEGENAPGSGTVFFSGCTLRCCFCQNYEISEKNLGKEVSEERLGEIFLQLQQAGAANLNLVTGTHYIPSILRALSGVKDHLTIPVAWNCGGYETIESIEALAGSIQIFMPDVKYYDSTLAGRFSHAPDYFDRARPAIRRMIELVGPPVFDAHGLLQSGVILRHLVLPGHRDDSLRLLDWIASELPRDGFLLSLMSQYTPYRPLPYPELNRKLSSFEYNIVVNRALDLGLTHTYTQQRTAAKEEYTPPFDFTGI